MILVNISQTGTYIKNYEIFKDFNDNFYIYRAKMMKEQLKDQANRADPKMDRLQAMAKISETFGYGEKIKGAKKEQAPKKPIAPTEPRSKKKIQASKQKIQDPESSRMKSKSSSNPAPASGVKKWDFGATSSYSSPGPRGKSSIEVDPELGMSNLNLSDFIHDENLLMI